MPTVTLWLTFMASCLVVGGSKLHISDFDVTVPTVIDNEIYNIK